MGSDDRRIDNSAIPPETPLQSWKEIAAYLERDERTARRWEKEEGLPIRRHRENRRSSVYAYPSELEAWRLKRVPAATPGERWHGLKGWSVAVGLLLILPVAWFVAYGPILNPPNPVVEAGGITMHQVWDGPFVDDLGDFSLDGRLLTYTDWDTGDLALRDLETGESRRLTDKGSWAESSQFAEYSVISPDSKSVAFSWYSEDGTYELRRLDLGGSEAETLVHCNKDEWPKPIDWLPGGKHLLVALYTDSSLRQLARVSIIDHSVTPIPTPSWDGSEDNLAISPDGEYIVYEHGSRTDPEQRDISIIPTAGGPVIDLVHHPSDDHTPTWSADGRTLLFASDRTGSLSLWIVPVENGKPSAEPALVKSDIGPLSRGMGCTLEGAFYFSLTAGMQDIFFFELNPQNNEVLGPVSRMNGRYVGANMGPTFSPDGKYVAYHFQRAPQLSKPGALTLLIRTLETGEEKAIPTSLIQWGPPEWFPDAKSVLVPTLRSEESRLIDYHRIDLESGRTEMIRKAPPNTYTSYNPDLSVDGKTIFFVEQRKEGEDSMLWPVSFKELTIESRKERTLHQLPRGQKAIGIRLSPDESNLTWVEWSRNAPSWTINVRPVTGGETREIFKLESPQFLRTLGSFVWLPDGQHILVSRFLGTGSESELIRVDLADGKTMSLGISMEQILIGDIQQDGGLVAFTSGHRKGNLREIWAIEGFLPADSAPE